MTEEAKLLRLDEICKQYLNLSKAEAARAAALHTLPFPVFKLRDSRKAPYMVKVTDLTAFIDKQASAAREQWERSQT
jgi:hypothetical protein